MLDSSIDDKLHRLKKEFDELLGDSNNLEKANRTTPERLVQRFDLTLDEAKAWLEQEPNFMPSDGFLQRRKSDTDLTKPERRFCATSVGYAYHAKIHQMFRFFLTVDI
jgi:hypothetical protein